MRKVLVKQLKIYIKLVTLMMFKFLKTKIYIYNVKENPVIDLISIEGNKEISDELILEN